jgi:transglutaminase-like putative cysteine protease
MRLSIQHETHYEYSAPLQYAMQQLCLTPQNSEHQTVLDWSVVAPGPLFAQRDGWGNAAHSWSLARQKQGRHIYRGSVRAAGRVQTRPAPLLADGAHDPPLALYLRPTALTTADAAITELARGHLRAGRIELPPLLALAAAVRERVRYRTGATRVDTTAHEAYALGEGVCQDHAHVFIAACRAAGLAARYVSGYFHSAAAPELSSHAWADVCVDPHERRWLSVDITHDGLMDERHVRLAVGPDYVACAPVRGVREGGGDETMRVRVQISAADDREAALLEP